MWRFFTPLVPIGNLYLISWIAHKLPLSVWWVKPTAILVAFTFITTSAISLALIIGYLDKRYKCK